MSKEEEHEKGRQHNLLDDIACFVGVRLHVPRNMGPVAPIRFGILDSGILQMAVERIKESECQVIDFFS